jgi:hypothetical protein
MAGQRNPSRLLKERCPGPVGLSCNRDFLVLACHPLRSLRQRWVLPGETSP